MQQLFVFLCRCFAQLQRCFVGLRACLHGGGGPQLGEVTSGRSPHLPCKRDQIKMRDYADRRVTHQSGLPHLPGVPHLHVNRPLVQKNSVVVVQNNGKERQKACCTCKFVFLLIRKMCCTCNLFFC